MHNDKGETKENIEFKANFQPLESIFSKKWADWIPAFGKRNMKWLHQFASILILLQSYNVKGHFDHTHGAELRREMVTAQNLTIPNEIFEYAFAF